MYFVGLCYFIKVLSTLQMYRRVHHHSQLSPKLATLLLIPIHSASSPEAPAASARGTLHASHLLSLNLIVTTPYFSVPSLPANTDPSPEDT